MPSCRCVLLLCY